MPAVLQWQLALLAYFMGAAAIMACTPDEPPQEGFVPLAYAYTQDGGALGVSNGECQLAGEIGLAAWLCIQGTAPATKALPTNAHRALVTVRVVTQDECPTRNEPGWVTYGCWDGADINDPDSRIILHAHTIGPNSICPHGTPMDAYSPACWRQFYAVLRHEIEHDVFGPSYGHEKSVGGWVIYGGKQS